MADISKCVACGGDTIAYKTPETIREPKVANIRIECAKPELLPFNLFICSACGFWNMYSLELSSVLKKGPSEIRKD